MGYTASQIHGEAIVIRKSRASDLVNLLREAQKEYGHISWCETVETYEQRATPATTASEIAVRILEDYGFVTRLEDDDSIQIIGWGGDKIGSSWDAVWNALAQVAHADVLWIMCGEDQEVWTESLSGGERTTSVVDWVALVKQSHNKTTTEGEIL